jgi:hypothetical protein
MSADACTWSGEEDGSSWSTSCRRAFWLEDGTPSENEMRFCCFCGKPLKEEVDAEDAE